MNNISGINLKILFLAFSILILISLSGCELLDLFASKQNPLLDEDCNIIPDKFNAGWKKYSDFDYRIDPETRSPGARQFHEAQQKIAKLGAEVTILKRDYEIEKEAIKAIQDYQRALKAGHKANLIKTTVRMSYVTYKVMESAVGTGKIYSEFLTNSIDTGIEVIGKAIKIGKALTPPNSSIAIKTKTIEGKATDVVATGWVETLASYGNPKDVVIEVMKKTKDHSVPNGKLTSEELDILRQEAEELKRVDKVIQLSTKVNLDRLWEYRGKEAEINILESSLWDYEQDEKDRVRDMLVAECERDKE